MANNAAPDVRVRLSAEGVAEVVKAFKQVQTESEKTKKAGASSGGAIGQLMGNLGGLKSLIPTITVAGIITGFVAMAKGALDAAAAIGKMNQRTGLSVQTLSVIGYAAQKTGSDLEVVEKGFVKFDKAMLQLDNNSKATRDALQDLTGSADSLNGLNTDERLKKVIDALAQMEPSYRRTALAQEFFGRGGAQLLPIIDKLGGEGFAKLREEAEKVGLMYDKSFIQAARQAKAGMRQLQLEARGMATQFSAGLIPAISDAGAALMEATGGSGINGFKMLGEFAGNVIKTIISALVKIGLNATWIFGRVASLGTRTFELINNAAHGRIKVGWEAFKQGIINDSTALDKTLQDKYDKFQMALEGKKRLKPEPEPVQDETDYSYKPDEGKIEKARRAALALAEANQDAAARVAAAELKQREAEEKEKYEKGLESLNEYYQARLDMTREQAAKEEKALYDKIQQLQKAPLGKDELQDERQAEIVKASADYQVKVLENTAALKALEAERAKEMEDLQQKALEFEKKIQKVQADRYRAAKADIDAQAAALDALLQKQGVAPAQRSQRVEAFRQAGYQEIDFGQLQNDGDRAIKEIANARADINRQAQAGQLTEMEREQQIANMERARLPILQEIAKALSGTAITDEQRQAAADFQVQIESMAFNQQRDLGTQALQQLDRARQDIQRKVQEGQLYEFQGEEQIRQLEIQRLPLLQQIADAMKAAAITDEQRQAVADFQAQIDQLATSTNKAALESAAFKRDVQGALTSDLTNWFSSGIDGAESLGDAFRGLAASVVQSLRQIASQMLANLLIQKMLGLVGGIAGGAPAGGSGGGSAPVFVASGGLVRGPGTGTSDSIAARLSDYEYVVRSAVVRKPGVLEFLSRLNSGGPVVRTPKSYRFAQGGLVDVAASGKGGQAGITAVLGLDEALLLKRVEASPEFSRVIVRTAANNQKAMNNALGR